MPGPAQGRHALAMLALVLLTTAAFLPVTGADFINYDDPRYVTGNPAVLKGLDAEGLRWAFTTLHAANWHPLTWISHQLDVTLFGLRAGPHHLTSLLLHTGSTLLLLLLLNALTGAWWLSFLTAALFAIHPLRVESVAWISERKDVLSVLLGLATLMSYLRYARRPGIGRYLIVIAAFSLGLMAKPMLVTLPFLLLLLDWWPLGRLYGATKPVASFPMLFPWRLLIEKAPLLLLAAASSVVTYTAQQRGGAIRPTEAFPLALRVENALVSAGRYISHALWPHDLIPFYRHPGNGIPLRELLFTVVFLVAVTFLAFAARKHRPWLLTGWLWFLGTLVPVLGLIQVGLQGMADRYSYLPLTGLFIAISWEIGSRPSRTGRSRTVRGVALVSVILALTLLTWRQTTFWSNTLNLFTRVVSVDPGNFTGYNMLGSYHLTNHEPAKAVPLFRTALQIMPAYKDSRFNLGLALAELGDSAGAIEQFTALLRVNPNDAECLYNLGKALLELGRASEALRSLDAAQALNPAEPAILFSRGLAFTQLDRMAEAAGDFRKVLELDPENTEARDNLEHALRLIRR